MGLDYISDAGFARFSHSIIFFFQIDACVSDVWLTQSNDDDNVNSSPTLDRRHATGSRYILPM
jgi:hypothetical protein